MTVAAPPAAGAAPALSPKKMPNDIWVLPKGVSLIIGIVVSALLTIATFFLTRRLFDFLFSIDELIGFWGWLSNAVSLMSALYVGYLTFFDGRMERIPIGDRGVPTIFGGRMEKPFRFLYPEGDNWGIPALFGFKIVNMHGRPLIEKDGDPRAEEIRITALTRASIPDEDAPSTPTRKSRKKKTKRKLVEGMIEIGVTVAVRIQIFDPFLYFNFQEVEGLLYNFIEQEVRIFSNEREYEDLVTQKVAMGEHLAKAVEKLAQEMGVNFIKIVVTSIAPPAYITQKGAELIAEKIDREKVLYRAGTMARQAATLKAAYPHLKDIEVRDFALVEDEKATMTIYSFNGKGNFVPIVGTNPGSSQGQHH